MGEEVRGIMEACFAETEQPPFRIPIPAEYQHAAPRTVASREGDGVRLLWHPLKLTLRPEILDAIVTRFVERMEKARWECEAICSMSSTGTILAALLSSRLHKPFVVADNIILTIFPDRVGKLFPERRPVRIVCVDSVVFTGLHLQAVDEAIRDQGGECVGALVIAVKDREQGEERLRIVDQWLEQKKLACLFTLGEVREAWGRHELKLERL